MPILLRRLTCFLSFDPPGKDLKDFYEQIPIILRELVARLNDENGEVLKTTHMAFSALSKHVPAEELVNHVEFMRNQISSLVSDARRRKGGVGDGEFLLPGFNIPKGLSLLSRKGDMMNDFHMIGRPKLWGHQRLVFLIACQILKIFYSQFAQI